MGDQQDSQQDEPPELIDLLRFTTTCLGLGIPAPKVAGDFRFGLEDLRQRGILPLEEVARIRAVTAGEATDRPEEWAAGFAEGYRSAWAAAVLSVLDTRGVVFDKHLHRGLNLCLDTDKLTRFLDRAVTATHEADLVAGEPSQRSPDGS
ncbi:hypothetical protein QQM39_16835 [Streptomyces sp. DT2A-34]|uniref:hypothetical protein n=1 Tax=Streptomyces sp. DT2A-34 TaxID=3051182 RepID=UPI00265C43CC|nr:hypothetical protein [Streptomyces sp. DT2A-34]MDO0912455.1 hypothetical protein [Streptomyces sp. DT2A-34]